MKYTILFLLSLIPLQTLAYSNQTSQVPAGDYYAEMTGNNGNSWVSSATQACEILKNHHGPTNVSKTETCRYIGQNLSYAYPTDVGTSQGYYEIEMTFIGTTNPRAKLYFFAPGGPQPPCESPTYRDPDSGECVAPEEICFTTFIDMADQCVYIGADDPADEIPPGCALDPVTGKTFCLSEDPNCYTVDGNLECPVPDSVCGEKNGVYECITPQEEGCGYFNGELLCFAPSGDPVPGDSPDHPDNGGNLDGDPTNDLFDSRDPLNGGDPDNQIDGPIEPTTDADRATEKTAREQLLELKKMNKKLEDLTRGQAPSESGASTKIDAAKDQLINDTGIGALTDGMGTNPFSSNQLGTIPGVADGLIPQTTCSDFSADILGNGVFSISCEDTNLVRTIIAWIVYVLTAIYIFQTVTNRSARS